MLGINGLLSKKQNPDYLAGYEDGYNYAKEEILADLRITLKFIKGEKIALKGFTCSRTDEEKLNERLNTKKVII